MKLYHYWRSSCSWRVRWALDYKGINYSKQKIDLLTAEQRSESFVKLNPLGMIPALELECGNVLVDSMAILEYLEEKYPEKPLLPQSSLDRVNVRQMAEIIASFVQPSQNMRVQKFLNARGENGQEIAVHWIKTGLTAFETLLEKHSGTFCFGSQFSHADICLIPQVYNAKRFGVSMLPYPNIERIYRTCMGLDSAKSSSPENNQ